MCDSRPTEPQQLEDEREREREGENSREKKGYIANTKIDRYCYFVNLRNSGEEKRHQNDWHWIIATNFSLFLAGFFICVRISCAFFSFSLSLSLSVSVWLALSLSLRFQVQPIRLVVVFVLANNFSSVGWHSHEREMACYCVKSTQRVEQS